MEGDIKVAANHIMMYDPYEIRHVEPFTCCVKN